MSERGQWRTPALQIQVVTVRLQVRSPLGKRRYSDFRVLWTSLMERYPHRARQPGMTGFPGRQPLLQAFSVLTPGLLQARVTGLTAFLSFLQRNADVMVCHDVAVFLDVRTSKAVCWVAALPNSIGPLCRAVCTFPSQVVCPEGLYSHWMRPPVRAAAPRLHRRLRTPGHQQHFPIRTAGARRATVAAVGVVVVAAAAVSPRVPMARRWHRHRDDHPSRR